MRSVAETSSHAIWECWKPGCTALLTDASLTFQLNASGKIALDASSKPAVMLTPENCCMAEIMSQYQFKWLSRILRT